MVENFEQSEQKTPQKNNQQKETLDQVLASKISDEITLNKVRPIFEDIQKQFTKPINNYIKTLDELEFYHIADADNDAKKTLVETIDMYFKNNGTPEIITLVKENTNIKKETTDEKGKTTDEKKETTDEKKETTDEKEKTTENISENENLIKQRKATKESYAKLDSKYQITDEQLQKEKANIPQNIINQITEKTQGTDLKVDDYLKFYLTAETNKEALKDTEFMKNYEKLNKSMGIVGESTNLKKMSTNPEHTDDIVNQNEDLHRYANDSKTLNDLSIPKLPETKNIDREFATYVKFISDKDLQDRIIRNEDSIKLYSKEEDEEKIKDEKGEKAYEEYKTAIQTIQAEFPTKTQEIMKKRVLGTCITGLANYFDTTTANKENFADDFDINTQKGFSIKKGERKYDEQDDDILYIKGNINGNDVGFYYNLDNPDAQLKSDDFLSFDSKSNTFALGAGTGGKTELGVKLPTLGLLTRQAQTIVDANFADGINNASNLEDFETTLKQKISDELLKNYGQEALVKTRVERDCEKNISIQTLQNTFIPDTILLELNRDSSINKTTENKARKLLEIWDTTTENMRSDELRRLRSLTERLDPLLTDRADHPQENLEPKRQKLLQEIDKERTTNTYTPQRGSKIVKFFRKFSKNDKINLEDLDTFITGLEKKESIGMNIKKYSPDFQTTEDHEDADNLLNDL